jgi:hypothetical protein
MSDESRNAINQFRAAAFGVISVYLAQFSDHLVAGALSRQRLLGADRIRTSRGAGPGLRIRSGDCLRRRGDRPACSFIRARGLRVQPTALSCPVERKIGGWTRPRRWSVETTEDSQRCAGCTKRAWASSASEFVQVLRLLEVFGLDDVLAALAKRLRAGSDWLRCRQTPGAVPDRAPPAAARSEDLSLSATGDWMVEDSTH